MMRWLVPLMARIAATGCEGRSVACLAVTLLTTSVVLLGSSVNGLAQSEADAGAEGSSQPVAGDHAQAGPEPSSSASVISAQDLDGLVPIARAASVSGQVQVAGSVDRSTVVDQDVDGRAGYGFEIFDATGSRLPVVASGKRPEGFDVAETVLVAGSIEENLLLASEVLIPGAAEWPDPNRGLAGVMVISLIVWLGLFAYMFRVDRKVHRMEVS